MILSVLDQCRTIETEFGLYAVYSDKSGAELWIQKDTDGYIVGANPHFTGSSSRPIQISKLHETPNHPFDGSVEATSDNGEQEYPFYFDAPNFRVLSGEKETAKKNIQLAAFAHNVTFFNSEEEFDLHDQEKLGMPHAHLFRLACSCPKMIRQFLNHWDFFLVLSYKRKREQTYLQTNRSTIV